MAPFTTHTRVYLVFRDFLSVISLKSKKNTFPQIHKEPKPFIISTHSFFISVLVTIKIEFDATKHNHPPFKQTSILNLSLHADFYNSKAFFKFSPITIITTNAENHASLKLRGKKKQISQLEREISPPTNAAKLNGVGLGSNSHGEILHLRAVEETNPLRILERGIHRRSNRCGIRGLENYMNWVG